MLTPFLAALFGAAVVLMAGRLLRRGKPGQVRYCPWCSSTLRDDVINGKTRKRCPRCSFVHWNNPISVAVVVIPKGDGLVLIKRGVEPRKGKYGLVAGFVDEFETPLEAAVREAKEEAGLDVKIVRMLEMRKVPHLNQFLVFFLAEPVTAEPVAGDDAEEAAVFTAANIPTEIAFPSHKEVIERFFAEKNR